MVAATLLVWWTLALGAPLPEVEALSVVARVEGSPTPVRLRGALGQAETSRAQRETSRVVADVGRRFLQPVAAAAHPPVDLCLFETEPAYVAFTTRVCGPIPDCSPLGFYQPGRRLIVANLGRSIGNLRHELAHALIGDDFPGIPAWLNEGIGALYGTAKFDGKSFGFAVNYRMRDVKAALAAGTLPTLAQLARSNEQDVYGPRAMVYYGLARHLLLYLDQQNKLSAFYRAMRDDAHTVDAQTALLAATVDEKAFLEWVRKQK